MKQFLLLIAAGIFLTSCGNDSSKNQSNPDATTTATEETADGNPSYDPNRGAGKFSHVDVGATLDVAMADKGEKTFEVKCSSCHKLSDEKLVGPGWKDVTKRHTPEWIMNFMTNTDEMLDKDPKAQAQLEICLVRMPNQNLTDDEARSLLEFMRKNDGVK